MKTNKIDTSHVDGKNIRPLKIGFDIHGVIDTFGQINCLLSALAHAGAEIHIITGQRYDSVIKDLLSNLGIRPNAYFSIVEYLENKGVPIEWKDNLPFADKEQWNNAKKEYCASVGIDILFDDSPAYQQTFNDSKTLFCLVNNPNRKVYETRKE